MFYGKQDNFTNMLACKRIFYVFAYTLGANNRVVFEHTELVAGCTHRTIRDFGKMVHAKLAV
jgi:hypothetical protein